LKKHCTAVDCGDGEPDERRAQNGQIRVAQVHDIQGGGENELAWRKNIVAITIRTLALLVNRDFSTSTYLIMKLVMDIIMKLVMDR